MWIFTRHGFISLVAHKYTEGLYQVKARNPEPLLKLFPDYELIVIEWADYRYRVEVPQAEVTKVVAELVDDVDYTSYKDECHDDLPFYRALTNVWTIMLRFQQFHERIG